MPAEPLCRVRRTLENLFPAPLVTPPQPTTVALAGVSFRFERGRTLGVIGASGSGKSTLARCLTEFETPTSGEIVFEDVRSRQTGGWISN